MRTRCRHRFLAAVATAMLVACAGAAAQQQPMRSWNWSDVQKDLSLLMTDAKASIDVWTEQANRQQTAASEQASAGGGDFISQEALIADLRKFRDRSMAPLERLDNTSLPPESLGLAALHALIQKFINDQRSLFNYYDRLAVHPKEYGRSLTTARSVYERVRFRMGRIIGYAEQHDLDCTELKRNIAELHRGRAPEMVATLEAVENPEAGAPETAPAESASAGSHAAAPPAEESKEATAHPASAHAGH